MMIMIMLGLFEAYMHKQEVELLTCLYTSFPFCPLEKYIFGMDGVMMHDLHDTRCIKCHVH